MTDNISDKFLAGCQFLIKPSNSVLDTADNKRNNLVHTFSASLNLLDNDCSVALLEQHLDDYTRFVDEHCPFDRKFKATLAKHGLTARNQQTDLSREKVQNIIKPFSCSKSNELFCKTSENISKDEFKCFVSSVIKRSNTQAKNAPLRSENKTNNISTNSYGSIGIKKFDRGNSFSIERNTACSKGTENNARANVNSSKPLPVFKTASEVMQAQTFKRNGSSGNIVGQKRRLGSGGGVRRPFVSPMLSNNENEERAKAQEEEEIVDERLKHIEPKMVELIKSEIMDCGPGVDWNDIAGLEFAKTAIQEAVVWPMLRPDIFTGLRRPPKGILLFGPPGTGKTLIGKCVASQSKSTFFSISASSLTSKWIGDGEKMVRALFAVARVEQPSVIFIDEIDSLLSQRNETEHESSRRIKTEFLVQLDGATTVNEERILVIGATNRPQELDEAARRRFVKRLYIPLPELEARLELVQRLMCSERHCLTDANMKEIAQLSNGYSGADMRNLCSEASLGPIRSIDMNRMQTIQAHDVRPVSMEDFQKAFTRVRSSVAPKDLDQYLTWDNTYGSGVSL